MFVESLFTEEKSGILRVPVRELEEHLRKTYSDNQRYEPISRLNDTPPFQPPVFIRWTQGRLDGMRWRTQ